MKNIFLAIAALLLASATAQAAKPPVEFYPGVEGYLPNPDVYYVVEDFVFTNDLLEVYRWIDISFVGMSPKDTLTFTKLSLDKPGYELGIFIGSPIKAVAYKGKTPGRVGGIYCYDDTPSIKMKNVTIGDVSTFNSKNIQCADVESIGYFSYYDKGTVVKASGHVGYMAFFPQDADHYCVVDGCFKSISAGDFGDVIFCGTTPKTLVLKAKKPSEGTFYITNDLKYKSKNVNVQLFE